MCSGTRSNRQSFAAARYRRQFTVPRQRLSEVLFEQHKDILEPLIGFLTTRGRLPEDVELPETDAICQALGSLKPGLWQSSAASPAMKSGTASGPSASRTCSSISRSHASRAARASPSSRATSQRDVRVFFSSYRRACALADDLLFSAGDRVAVDQACRSAAVGKLTRQAPIRARIGPASTSTHPARF